MNKIKSLEEYFSEIDLVTKSFRLHSFTTTHAWFRGQSDSSYHLVPGIFRNGGDNFYEREIIRDFKLFANQYIQHPPENDLEWLFIMQHYGMPTRLLDWTESYLFALYFAIANYKKEKDACVWVLDPWTLNSLTIELGSIPTPNYYLLNDYKIKIDSEEVCRKCNAKYPVAIRPVKNTNRITAQKGTFTLHGAYDRGLDQIEKELYQRVEGGEIFLSKIIIDGSYKLYILKELTKAGISHSILFPEIQGIAEELNFRYSKEYMMMNGHRHKGIKL